MGIEIDDREILADETDRASRAEMEINESRIAEASRLSEQRQKPDAQGNYKVLDCIDCDNPIGEERLRVAANNLHCVHCAGLNERRKRWS